ncbi:MAG: glutamyl-tRNA reductase [Actinomycetota bacterium]|nr:glutamyl-tRNA reductase [Actinomycetota bacterium]MDQ3680861.1 glutamyl-tRNA reductase [Actinomycetota bacterium]
MSVVVVGLNYRTVPLELLERMTVSASSLPKALADLRARENLAEVVVVSTCMRTEVYVLAERFHPAVGEVRDFLAELSFAPPEDFSDRLYSYYGEGAVAQLFRVVSGIDSAVLGESEVLGQVRGAWERAAAEGAAGPVLGGLFRHALEVGKRARSETRIGRGTTSISQAAVEMAGERLGTLEDKRILVLGSGQMGKGMAVALAGRFGTPRKRHSPAELMVASRSWPAAESVAARTGGEAVPFQSVDAALVNADVVLTSTGAPSALLHVEDLEPVMAARGGRELLVVDVAVPRDVDPAVGEVPGVTLLDMEDLRSFAEAGMAERRREVAHVDAIVETEVSRYMAASTARELAPLIVTLRQRAEGVRGAEIDRYRSRLEGLDDRQREAVEGLTRGILAKLLHEPTVRLKDAAGSPRGDRLAEALRDLFDL